MYRKIRCYNERFEEVEDFVAEEVEVSIFGNGELIAELRCSPNDLEELGAGHVVCEGFASKVSKVEVSEHDIYVDFSSGKRENIDGKVSIKDVFELVGRLSESPVWKITGGTHSVAVKSSDVRVFEDVSRSCAFDKAIGYATLEGFVPKIVAVSCRLSYIIVRKAINSGVPIIASKAAATKLAIDIAKKYGITLIGFVREGRAKIYTHPERITKFK